LIKGPFFLIEYIQKRSAAAAYEKIGGLMLLDMFSENSFDGKIFQFRNFLKFIKDNMNINRFPADKEAEFRYPERIRVHAKACICFLRSVWLCRFRRSP